MSDPFVGEIRIFPYYGLIPKDWAQCNGQLLPVAQNTALYAILGTTYGGSGSTTFALPNLRERIPLHFGAGPGLSSRTMGETGGQSTHSLSLAEMPAHGHPMHVQDDDGAVREPGGNMLGNSAGLAYRTGAAGTPLSPSSTSTTGAGAPHHNMMPSIALRYCISLAGIFPIRS